MKTLMTVILLSGFLCLAALAMADPQPDVIGVYFDTGAQTTCQEAIPSIPLQAYVIITNPSSEVHGVQFTLCTEVPSGNEANLFELGGTWPGECPPPITLDLPGDPCLDGHIRTCTDPVPPGAGGVVVLTTQYMLLTPFEVAIHLGPVPGAASPSYLGSEGQEIPLEVASGNPVVPVASIEIWCGLPTTETTFGTLKSLYR